MNQSNVSDLLSEYRTSAKRIESLESKMDTLLAHMCKSQNTSPDKDSFPQSKEGLGLIHSLPVGLEGFQNLNEKISKDPEFKRDLVSKMIETS